MCAIFNSYHITHHKHLYFYTSHPKLYKIIMPLYGNKQRIVLMKQRIFFVALWCISSLYAHKQVVVGRSFMLTHPGYQQLSTHNQLWHEIIFNKPGPFLGAFQITPFFQKSIAQEKSNIYFLINNKENLLISGDQNNRIIKTRDVRAEWLGLPANFSGNFSLRPEQLQMGMVVEYNQDLKNIMPISFFQDWQVNIAIPFVMVENSLQPCQTNIQNRGLQTPHDILEAFNQPAWCFNKIYNHRRSKSGIAEIKVTLESPYLVRDHFLIAYHSGLVIPAGKKQNGEFLFDPIVGYNRHVGIVGGVDFQLLLNRDPSQFAFCFFTSLESTFLIRNKQKRTFDLRNKPWSRFLLYNRIDGGPNQNIPGVNIFTRECTVRPHNVVEFATGWRFMHSHCTFECGYNIWGHDVERIEKLSHPFPSIYGIATQQDPTDIDALTASTSTIAQLGVTDQAGDGSPLFVPIVEKDLDLESAATGSALNHKAHFAIGIKNIGKKNNGFIGFGGFIDVPQKNGALKLYGFWTKVGISF